MDCGGFPQLGTKVGVSERGNKVISVQSRPVPELETLPSNYLEPHRLLGIIYCYSKQQPFRD